MARVIGVNFESVVDGEGVRVVIFFSGCKHACKGCHNPDSHPFHVGREFDAALQQQVIHYVQQTPFISGITLSGGDPMYSASDIIPFVEKFRSAVPGADIWIYSGFTYEEILSHPDMSALLSLCDVLVDGPFILEERDITLNYRGSKNQRIIHLS